MPSQARVQAFIKTVEANDFVRAIEDFYTDDATMRENMDPPRCGRPTLVERERAMLKTVDSIKTRRVARLLVDGDQVVINWIFDIMGHDGVTRVMDELSIQRWHGDRIAEEQFYYNPKLPTA